MGAFGEVKLHSALAGAHFVLDAASLNQPTSGDNYLSQGAKASFRLLKWDFGLGYERKSFDFQGSGRPNWKPGSILLGWEAIDLSKEGLEASVGGGIFIGASAAASTGPLKCKVEP
jgi:hypothetical protein